MTTKRFGIAIALSLFSASVQVSISDIGISKNQSYNDESVCIGSICFSFFDNSDNDELIVPDFIEEIYPDTDMFVSDENIYEWHLDRIDGVLDGSNFVQKFPGDPNKHVVFVMDTGTQLSHNFFKNKDNNEKGFDVYPEEGGPDKDLNGHGTHVATTASQIVPEAKIIACKVLRANGSGSTSGIIKALSWAVDQTIKRNFTAVVNLSLGGGVNKALDKAVIAASEFLQVSVAAGNSNADACNYSPSGADPDHKAVNFFSVGASTEDDLKAGFSNYGECVNFYAPGVSIRAGWPTRTDTATRRLSGTSMATPIVSGILISMDHRNASIEDFLEYVPISRINIARLNNTFNETNHPGNDLESTIVDSNQTDVEYQHMASRFGPMPPHLESSTTWPAIYLGDDNLCQEKEREDLKGKIVVVDRGECLFYIKVMNAQNNGAAAVLIRNNKDTEKYPMIPPSYYGSGPSPRIPSAMIPHAWPLKDRVSSFISWGSLSYLINITQEPTSEPTPAPTVNCRDLGSRKKCRMFSDECTWKRKWRKCNFRHRSRRRRLLL